MLFRGLRKKPQAKAAPRGARHGAIAFLPIKTGDTEAADGFAKPLRDWLLATGLGDLTGHRLRHVRGAEPSGIEFHLRLATIHPRALKSIGDMLDDLDAPVGSSVEFSETGQRHVFGRTEGLAIDLSPETDWLGYAEAAIETLAGAAVYQGSREVEGARTLYFYGENATSIASTLKAAAAVDPRLAEAPARRLT